MMFTKTFKDEVESGFKCLSTTPRTRRIHTRHGDNPTCANTGSAEQLLSSHIVVRIRVVLIIVGTNRNNPADEDYIIIILLLSMVET